MKNSLLWSVIGSSVNKITSILVFIFMAKKLPPESFGIVAIAGLVLGFTKIFTESGYKEAIIYFKIEDHAQLSRVYWLLFIIGVLSCTILIIFREYISNFFGGGIEDIILYLSFLLLLSPLKVISLAILEKEMNFKKIINIESISLLVSSIIGLASAYNDYGVISLVLMILSNQIMQIVLFYISSGFRVKFSWSLSNISYIYSYSVHLIFITIVNFIVENLDKVIIGKTMEKSDLGIYERSQYLSLMPAMFVSTAIARVFFPKMAENKEKIKKIKILHINSLPIISFVGFPFLGLLVVLSEELVLLILGKHWIGMVPLLEVMALTGMFRILGFFNANIYKALGHTKLQNKINFLLKTILTVAILIGAGIGGLMGIVYALLVARFINLLITLYSVSNLIESNFFEIVKKPLLVMLYLLVYMLLFDKFKPTYEMMNLIDLMRLVSLYLVIYFSAGFIFFRKDYGLILRDFKNV